MKNPHLYRLGFAVLVLAAVTARGQQYGPGIDINITSAIDWREKDKRDADPAYAKAPVRAQHFFLARVSEERSTGINLVRPVVAKVLADQVTRQLELRGFQPVSLGGKPEIIVTVKYGRAEMDMMVPYTNTDDDPRRGGMSNSNPVTAWPTRERFVGVEERSQRLFRTAGLTDRASGMLSLHEHRRRPAPRWHVQLQPRPRVGHAGTLRRRGGETPAVIQTPGADGHRQA